MSVICQRCNRDMQTVDSCIEDADEYNDGLKLTPLKFYPQDKSERCHDCNIGFGGYHHIRCDVEDCPRCHRQFITCNCILVGEESESRDTPGY